MEHKRPPLPAIIVILLLIAAGIYYGIRALNSDGNGKLTASGTIESVVVNVSPEMAGKVKEVLVDEGQSVKTGGALLSLDDSLLASQRAVTAAQLSSAMAGAQVAQDALTTMYSQYQITLSESLAQDQKTRLQDWFTKDPNQFDQPEWYFTRDEQFAAAQAKVDVTQKALEDAQANLTKVTQSLEVADFIAAENRVLNARVEYSIAKDVNDRAQNSVTSDVPTGRYNVTHCGTNDGYFVNNSRLTNRVYGCTGDEYLSDSSQNLYDQAQTELDNAQQAYNDLLTTHAADQLSQARANVSVAQERYYSALDYLRNLQRGDQSLPVTAAEDSLKQAQATADQAEKTVDQARANLELLDTQISKLVVYAPMDGVILVRNVEPGEFVQPGSTALSMADLSNLTITVYVPEDRYGQISLGQQAEVTVDSFPGTTFSADITYISDQAEFTPRNVQTVEGRSSTVYAVKLKVTDSEGKLKIGMPADVVFVK
jgi:multidrug resistance efflux pump